MLQVFQAEYSLMCDIVRCPIPYISICNGIWMGFGVGFAVHGDVRIVTENTMFAMPENMIGLWPDVGFARVAANNAPGVCAAHMLTDSCVACASCVLKSLLLPSTVCQADLSLTPHRQCV